VFVKLFRKIVFWAHLVVGVAVGVVVLNFAVTGMTMTYQPQIEAWAEKKQRRVEVPASGAARLGIGEILAKVKEHNPKAKPASITLRSDPQASVAVGLGSEDGTLYVNPYTGGILGGDSSIHHFLHWIEHWHRWFGSREIGRPITGAACLGLFFLVLSGLYMWFPRNEKALKAILFFNLDARGKARDWNWHHVFGFWCSPLLLLTTMTGLVVSYPWANNLLFRLTGNEPPPPPPERRVAGGPDQGNGRTRAGQSRDENKNQIDFFNLNFESMFSSAVEKVPDWESISFRAPRSPGGPITASITESVSWGAAPRSQLSLNPQSAAVVKWEPYSEQNSGRRLRMWIIPLHTGRAWGWFGQTLAGVGALGAAVLVWTGLALMWRRFRTWKSRPPPAKDGFLETSRAAEVTAKDR
jgi:uncharacterized iron-regulated membrane protein